MTERKPVEISDEDWANTPSTVRGFVSQSITRLEQLEAQFQMVLSPPQIASSALLLSPLHIFARVARSTGWLLLTSVDGAHLAADPAGNLYITVPEEGRVLCLTSSGETVSSWELPQPNGQKMRPVGVAIDPQGRVWVADSLGNHLVVITPE